MVTLGIWKWSYGYLWLIDILMLVLRTSYKKQAKVGSGVPIVEILTASGVSMAVDVHGDHVPFLPGKQRIGELRFEEGAIGDERVEKHQRRQVGVWYCGCRTVAKGDTVGESEGLGSRELHGFVGVWNAF
jgi:hypothetical protein